MTSEKREADERVRRTRGAIVESFNRLVLGRRYDAIQVGDIVERAGVGRSTFYEHFRGKDALLEHALERILGILADAATDSADARCIAGVLEHFLEHQKAARARFSGPSAAQLAQWIGKRIEQRVASSGDASELIVPAHLVARQAADAQVALVREWLRDPRACDSAALADVLCRTTRALIASARC